MLACAEKKIKVVESLIKKIVVSNSLFHEEGCGNSKYSNRFRVESRF